MMGLHELCTNATKHGALSRDEGRVAIRWRLGQSPDEVDFEWSESGGPRVEEPRSRGMGSRLLVANGGMKGVSMQFEPGGLQCRITVTR